MDPNGTAITWTELEARLIAPLRNIVLGYVPPWTVRIKGLSIADITWHNPPRMLYDSGRVVSSAEILRDIGRRTRKRERKSRRSFVVRADIWDILQELHRIFIIRQWTGITGWELRGVPEIAGNDPIGATPESAPLCMLAMAWPALDLLPIKGKYGDPDIEANARRMFEARSMLRIELNKRQATKLVNTFEHCDFLPRDRMMPLGEQTVILQRLTTRVRSLPLNQNSPCAFEVR